MAKIRKAVFRSGIVMMSLLAAIVLSSSVAYAQVWGTMLRARARIDPGTKTEVRAEGVHGETQSVDSRRLNCAAARPGEEGWFNATALRFPNCPY